MALAEDNLSSDIEKGENAGRNLSHVSVVRQLRGISRIESARSNYTGIINLAAEPDWNTDNLKVIVFLQENSTRVIPGVSRTSFDAPTNGKPG